MDYVAGCRAMLVVFALTGCGFDSAGDGNGGTTDSSTGTTDPSTSNPSTSNPSTTTDPATTDPATTDPATTDPATTDPTTTDPSTDPTTTDPATTDPATTNADATETSETDPSLGTSSGGDDGAYGPCDGNTCPDDQMCSVVVNEAQTVIGNSCREPCNAVGECPAPPGGDPEVLCPAPDYPWCVLGCEIGQCPGGMMCYQTQFGGLCYWPT